MIKMHALYKLPFYLLFVALMSVAYSCNSTTEEYEVDTAPYASTAVKGFSLKADSKVLKNLDSVFFSIDLDNAQIFNADSLPVGTDVSRLLIDLSVDYASEISLYVPRPGKSDTVINFIENPTDSIDFSNGPVKLHIVSLIGENKRDYTVKVNVHKMNPDSLYFNDVAYRALPSRFPTATITDQKTVVFGGKAYCLTARGTEYGLAVSSNPGEENWEQLVCSFPVSVKVATFTACDNALYVLANSGELLRSTDGKSWERTGTVWHSITAGYGDRLLGVKLDSGRYYHVAYPSSGTAVPVDQDFPVSGNSATVVYSSKWSENAQAIICGGVTSGGSVTGSTWSYDGSVWAKVGGGLPAASGYSVTKYTISQTDTTAWRNIQTEVLLAFGSRKGDGSIDRTVYVSKNMGITWSEGNSLLQLPECIASFYGADALVFSSTLTVSRSVSAWTAAPAVKLPSWYEIDRQWSLSRATAPITEWECPYLYIFGGKNSAGQVQPVIWRGAVNALTFKPLQ